MRITETDKQVKNVNADTGGGVLLIISEMLYGGAF